MSARPKIGDTVLSIVKIVTEARDGMRAVEAAALVGISEEHCGRLLWVAQCRGLVGHARVGRFALWGSPETVARLRAGFAATRSREAIKKAETRRLTRAGLRVPIKRGPRAVESDAIVQRWADASEPLPFTLKAPRSVFDWRPAA